MNLKQGLKRKSKLLYLIVQEMEKAITYNSIEEGNNRPYSVKEALQRWSQYKQQLIDLKTRIHTANLPVFHKIFTLSELKNDIKHLRSLKCTEGKTRARFVNEGELIQRVSEVSIVERDNMISEIESKIEKLQDELDEFNIITQI